MTILELINIFKSSDGSKLCSDKTIRACLLSTSPEDFDSFFEVSHPINYSQHFLLARVARLSNHVGSLIKYFEHSDIRIQRYAANSTSLYTSPTSLLVDPSRIRNLFHRVSPFVRRRVVWNLSKHSAKLSKPNIPILELFCVVREDWGLELALPMLWSCEPYDIRSYLDEIGTLKLNISAVQTSRIRQIDHQLLIEILNREPKDSHLGLKRQLIHGAVEPNDILTVMQLGIAEHTYSLIGLHGPHQVKYRTEKNISIWNKSDQKRFLLRHFESVIASPTEWLPLLDLKLLKKFLSRPRLLSLFAAQIRSDPSPLPSIRWNYWFDVGSASIFKAVLDGMNDRWDNAKHDLAFWSENEELLRRLPVDVRDPIAQILAEKDPSCQPAFNWIAYRSVEACTRIIRESLRYESDRGTRKSAVQTLMENAKINDSNKAFEDTINLVFNRYKNDKSVYTYVLENLPCLQNISEEVFQRIYTALVTDSTFSFPSSVFKRRFQHPKVHHIQEYISYFFLCEWSCGELILSDLPNELRETLIQKFIERSQECVGEDCLAPFQRRIGDTRILNTIQHWNDHSDEPFPIHKYPELHEVLLNTAGEESTMKFALDPKNAVPVIWAISIWGKQQPTVELTRTMLLELHTGRFKTLLGKGIDFELYPEMLLKNVDVTMIESTTKYFDALLELEQSMCYRPRGHTKEMASLFRVLRKDSRFDFSVDLMASRARLNIINQQSTTSHKVVHLFTACVRDDDAIIELVEELLLIVASLAEDAVLEDQFLSHESEWIDVIEDAIEDVTEECIKSCIPASDSSKNISHCIALLLNHLQRPLDSFNLIIQYLLSPLATTAIIRDSLSRLCYHSPMGSANGCLDTISTHPGLNFEQHPVGRPAGMRKHVLRLRCLTSLWENRIPLLEAAVSTNDTSWHRWICKTAVGYPAESAFRLLDRLVETPPYDNRKMKLLMRAAMAVPEAHRSKYVDLVIRHTDKQCQSERMSECFLFFLRDQIDYVPNDTMAELLPSFAQSPEEGSCILTPLKSRCVLFEYIAATARQGIRTSALSFPETLEYKSLKNCFGIKYLSSVLDVITSDSLPLQKDRVWEFIDFVIEKWTMAELQMRNPHQNIRIHSWEDNICTCRLPATHQGPLMRVICETLSHRFEFLSRSNMTALHMTILLDVALVCLNREHNDFSVVHQLGSICDRVLSSHPAEAPFILEKVFKSFFSRDQMDKCLYGQYGLHNETVIASQFITACPKKCLEQPSGLSPQFLLRCVLLPSISPSRSYRKVLAEQLIDTPAAMLLFF